MDKINIVKAVYYQMVVDGLHPVIGGSAALFIHGLVDDFNDINIIVPKGEFDSVDLKYDIFSPRDKSKPIQCIGYELKGIHIKILENILPHESHYVEIEGVRYATINDVRESRDIILDKFKDVSCLEMTARLVLKWNKQLI